MPAGNASATPPRAPRCPAVRNPSFASRPRPPPAGGGDVDQQHTVPCSPLTTDSSGIPAAGCEIPRQVPPNDTFAPRFGIARTVGALQGDFHRLGRGGGASGWRLCFGRRRTGSWREPRRPRHRRRFHRLFLWRCRGFARPASPVTALPPVGRFASEMERSGSRRLCAPP